MGDRPTTTNTTWKASKTDLIGGVGVGLFAIGLGQIYAPLAWLWFGALLIAAALLGAKREARRKRNQ